MTYPDLSVAASVNTFFVPVQLDVEKDKDQVQKFRVIWTPNINIMDSSENIFYHVEGWLPPFEFSAMLMTAHGQYCLKRKRYAEAKEIFQKTWEKFPQSGFSAEALYYLGVSGYMESHEIDALSNGWALLQKYHPQSTWAIRSSII